MMPLGLGYDSPQFEEARQSGIGLADKAAQELPEAQKRVPFGEGNRVIDFLVRGSPTYADTRAKLENIKLAKRQQELAELDTKFKKVQEVAAMASKMRPENQRAFLDKSIPMLEEVIPGAGTLVEFAVSDPSRLKEIMANLTKGDSGLRNIVDLSIELDPSGEEATKIITNQFGEERKSSIINMVNPKTGMKRAVRQGSVQANDLIDRGWVRETTGKTEFDVQKPTTSFQTEMQKALLADEIVLDQGTRLLDRLEGDPVKGIPPMTEAAGVSGFAIEEIGGLLEQIPGAGPFIGEMFNSKNVTEVRTGARMLVGALVRRVTQDTSGRYSDRDMELAQKVNSTLQATKSHEQTITSLREVIGIIQRGRDITERRLNMELGTPEGTVAIPTYKEWHKEAKKMNPDVSDDELKKYYEDKYGSNR